MLIYGLDAYPGLSEQVYEAIGEERMGLGRLAILGGRFIVRQVRMCARCSSFFMRFCLIITLSCGMQGLKHQGNAVRFTVK